MKLSELIKQLQAIKDEHGDLEAKTSTLSHRWDPEPTVMKRERRDGIDKEPWVLLNP